MSVTAMPQTDPTTEEGDEGRGSRKKLLLVVAVLLLAGGGAFMVARGSGGDTKPQPGAVVTLDPIQVNLAGEHYLRIGIALQLTSDAEAEVDGSKALDAVISQFSGQQIAQVNDPPARTRLKDKLLLDLKDRYHDEVMGVYFTEFVTQ